MLEMTLSSGHRARIGSSNRSMTVAMVALLPCKRAASSSGIHGRSSALWSTSKRFESDSTISGNTARVMRTLLTGYQAADRLLVEDSRQPEADVGEDVQQDQRDHLDPHERHHAGEDRVERHVRRRH